MLNFHSFVSPRGYSDPFDGYVSRFGFIWWFWLPQIHTQKSVILRGYSNPFVFRIIWLCFAVGFSVGKDGPVDG